LKEELHKDENQKPKHGFVVIGAGLPRTGTKSLRDALITLLNGPCHHMRNIMVQTPTDNELNFWKKAMDKDVAHEEWVKFFEGGGYRAAVDFPASRFYKEVMEAYPNAKVILTIRDPIRWYQSAKSTIYATRKKMRDPAITLLAKMTGKFRAMQVSHDITSAMHDAVERGEEEAVKFFNDWVAEVKAHVPEDKLLVFDVKEGWEPLCQFLGVPVPANTEFPQTLNKAEVRAKFQREKILSRLFFYILPATLLIVSVMYSYWTN